MECIAVPETAAPAGTRPATHVALVSHHPMPTLGPLLDPSLGCQKAILVAGRERAAYADHQAAVLERHGMPVRVETVRDAYDLDTLREDLALMLPTEEPVAINVTGGSKLMSIAAHLTAEQFGHAAYYIHLHEDSVRWLNRDWAPHPVADRIRLKDYLLAIGLEADHPGHKPFHGDIHGLAEEIAHNERLHRQVVEFVRLFKQPNGQAAGSYRFNRRQRKRLGHLEAELRATGLGRWEDPAADQSRFRFTHEQGMNFVDGTWLEFYAEACVTRLASQSALLHDVARGLLVRKRSGDLIDPITNELDVTFLFDNALYLIECKSGKQDRIVNDLHRLETLRDQLGGIRGRALLLALQPPGAGNQRRAAAMGIHLCVGYEALGQLEGLIADWLEGDLPTEGMTFSGLTGGF